MEGAVDCQSGDCCGSPSVARIAAQVRGSRRRVLNEGRWFDHSFFCRQVLCQFCLCTEAHSAKRGISPTQRRSRLCEGRRIADSEALSRRPRRASPDATPTQRRFLPVTLFTIFATLFVTLGIPPFVAFVTPASAWHHSPPTPPNASQASSQISCRARRASSSSRQPKRRRRWCERRESQTRLARHMVGQNASF